MFGALNAQVSNKMTSVQGFMQVKTGTRFPLPINLSDMTCRVLKATLKPKINKLSDCFRLMRQKYHSNSLIIALGGLGCEDNV